MCEEKKKRKQGGQYKYTPEELEKKIDEYFKDRIDTDRKVNFCSIRDLCIFLDIDRQTFYNWESYPVYSTITKKAREKILTAWEQQLFLPGRNTTGAIFYLKNYGGMADQVQHVHQGSIEYKHTAQLEDIPTEQLQQITAALEALEREKSTIDVTAAAAAEGEEEAGEGKTS